MNFTRSALCAGLACLSGCVAPLDTESILQAGLPRIPRPEEEMQGTSLTDDRVHQTGVRYLGVDSNGVQFKDVYVVDKTIEADSGTGVRLKGAELIGAILFGFHDTPAPQNNTPVPSISAGNSIPNLLIRIDDVRRPGTNVDSANDANTTRTYLYKLSARRLMNNVWSAWEPFCESEVDFENTNVWFDSQVDANLSQTERAWLEWATPVASLWSSTGAMSSLTGPEKSGFTFACMGGVIAKCEREDQGGGYHAWRVYHGLTSTQTGRLLQTCTRAFRADYCGTGQSFTNEGTPFNIFDQHGINVDDWNPASDNSGVLANPNVVSLGRSDTIGPTVKRYFTNPYFEAGWDVDGAHCLSQTRWRHMRPEFCTSFPDVVFDDIDGPHVCSSAEEAHDRFQVDVFNESEHFDLPSPYTQVQLTLTRQATAGVRGNVTSLPAGLINCGTDCSERVAPGKTVALVPPAGVVATWSGCTSIQNNMCYVTVTADKTVNVSLSCSPACYPACALGCTNPFTRLTCLNNCRTRCETCGN
jgi:hypothetical protein